MILPKHTLPTFILETGHPCLHLNSSINYDINSGPLVDKSQLNDAVLNSSEHLVQV